MNLEKKNLSFDFEMKNLDDKGEFVAYASTFGNKDLGDDVMVKGAFIKSLSEKSAKDVFMFWQHDSDSIIGEWKSMVEDERGLRVEGKLFLNDIQQAKEAFFLMKKGLIKKLSIGFQIVKKSYEGGKRMLEEVKLHEVSVVTFPMNTEADIIGVKSAKDLTVREFEKKLRDVGFTQKESKALIAEGWKGLQRDVVEDDVNEEEKAKMAQAIKLMKDL